MYLLYFALWVIFNGKITLEIVLFGVVIAAAIFAFTCKFMDYSISKELRLYRRIFGIFRFLYMLVRDIVKANFTVLHMIFSQKEELQPVIVSFHSDLKTPTARAFMANSITLTPGTITVTVEDSEYTVHCLDEDLAEGINSSEIVHLLEDLEK